MADKLTPQQEMAVHDRGGKLLVSAAAGSGKTKVLVDRLLSYLTDGKDPANLDDFLIITYTKAAASELRGKIAEKLTDRIAGEPENTHLQRQMQRLYLTKISTVHGFCSDVLREYAYRLDIPADFRVGDENECRELRDRVLTEVLDEAYRSADEDPSFRAFIDTQGLGRNDKLVPSIVEKVYDSARCHRDPEKWLDGCLEASAVEGLQDASETQWGRQLMEDLFSYLDKQLLVMGRCAQWVAMEPKMQSAASNLGATVRFLEALRQCESWDQIVALGKPDYGRLTFPKKDVNQELIDRVKAARDACKKGLEKKLQSFTDESAQVLADLRQTAEGTAGLIGLVRRFSSGYQKAKQSRRILDFGDLEHKMLDLLYGRQRTGITPVAYELGRRFREVMVDEYQDSNAVQDAIFEALTREKKNCFMVGDVKQSIYQFRLADPGIFLKKYETFVPAEDALPGQERKILLSHNFRSGPEVIEGVNDVFSVCMRPEVGGLRYTEAEALRQGIPRSPLAEPAVELYGITAREKEDIYDQEAAFVAEKIEKMLRSGTPVRSEKGVTPVKPEDIVILLRSPGSVGQRYQRALEARGIRCTTGGGMDLLQTEEISFLRALLCTVVNPRQDIPLVSVLASPVFGFSADELAAFRSRDKKSTLYDALLSWNGERGRSFLGILEELRRESGRKPLTQLLEKCYTLTRVDSIYAAGSSGRERLRNLQAFYGMAADFEAGNQRDLGQFLEYLDALEGRGMVMAAPNSGGAVTIMSIHKSKGLEFPVVFLCGLSRSFNRDSLRAQILCDEELGLGLSVVDRELRIRYPSIAKRAIMRKMTAQSISEELRVLYVAMTRARDRLVMTYTAKNLKSDLENVLLRRDFDGGELLCMEADCPGDWILLSALGKTEAGELFCLAGYPDQTHSGRFPWKIQVCEAPALVLEGVEEEFRRPKLAPGMEEHLKKELSWRYPHQAATAAPSKQTATGLKGRYKDEEAAQDTHAAAEYRGRLRRPIFRGGEPHGTQYGNTVHTVMQYIRYSCCGSVDAVRQEVARLVREKRLTEEAAAAVSCEKIAAFFRTEIGSKLQKGTPHLREFKFSILDRGDKYAPGLEDEQVLLQGVVDCALLEGDGITIVDFKTDHVTEESLPAAADRYALQVGAYADALSRIYEQRVKARYLYFFRLDRLVQV